MLAPEARCGGVDCVAGDFAAGHIDLDFVEHHATGYEAYRKEALRWTPEKVRETTGVEDSQVRAYAEMLAEKSPHAFMIGIGLQKGSNGAEAVRAVTA